MPEGGIRRHRLCDRGRCLVAAARPAQDPGGAQGGECSSRFLFHGEPIARQRPLVVPPRLQLQRGLHQPAGRRGFPLQEGRQEITEERAGGLGERGRRVGGGADATPRRRVPPVVRGLFARARVPPRAGGGVRRLPPIDEREPQQLDQASRAQVPRQHPPLATPRVRDRAVRPPQPAVPVAAVGVVGAHHRHHDVGLEEVQVGLQFADDRPGVLPRTAQVEHAVGPIRRGSVEDLLQDPGVAADLGGGLADTHHADVRTLGQRPRVGPVLGAPGRPPRHPQPPLQQQQGARQPEQHGQCSASPAGRHGRGGDPARTVRSSASLTS